MPEEQVLANDSDGRPSGVNVGLVAHQHVRRDPKLLPQPTNHCQRQRSAAIEDLRDPRAATENTHQIGATETGLLHPEENCLDRMWRENRMVPSFVSVDERDQDIEPICFG